MSNLAPPRLIAVSSYAGALPFMVFGAGVFLAGTDFDIASGNIVRAYGAVILSFIGGVQWGVIIGRHPVPSGPVLAGLFASLSAWLALLTPLSLGLTILAASFVLQFVADFYAIRRSLLPDWYLRLRTALTVTVATILLVTALFSGLP